MDAAGAFRKSDVQPVVHENVRGGSVARLVFRGPMQSLSRKPGVGSSGKIFLPNLNPIDAGSCGGLDLRQQSL
ncbi:MAG: hypothetical protein DMG45_06240 [Acidobacteria bacterium]|nr:MAG: hypothetical protein DMG45_06240 [Acidobacteriota bacterium]